MVVSTWPPPLAALGNSTLRLARTMVAEVSMKITSNTSTMSTKGMMLIDARGPSSSSISSRRAMGLLTHRRDHFRGLELRQQDARQHLATRDRALHPPAKSVVRDHRRDGHQQADSGGHQGLGDTGHHRGAGVRHVGGQIPK